MQGYSWKRTDAHDIRIVLTGQSELYPLNVTANFPYWAGPRRLDRFLLIVLWVALSFWFMTIVNNIFFATIEDISPEAVAWEVTISSETIW